MREGATRVKEAHAQRLQHEFENICFKDGELVDDFSLRITTLAENLRRLGETVSDTHIMKKMLRVLPKRYSQIAVSIKTLLDVNTLAVEDLVGRLRTAEDRIDVDTITEKSERLMLSEDEWLSKYRHWLMPESSSRGGGERQGGFTPVKSKNAGRGEKKEPVVKLTSEGMSRRKGRCRNCGIYGHWKQDCQQPKKEHREEARHV
ncbi:uncharacterized protein [Miscanthus floridulus]|uniref:uncharacterized protein n=1 Tax=Miscanthus floridulus TaxID=154761 RepID=UPI003457FE27